MWCKVYLNKNLTTFALLHQIFNVSFVNLVIAYTKQKTNSQIILYKYIMFIRIRPAKKKKNMMNIIRIKDVPYFGDRNEFMPNFCLL